MGVAGVKAWNLVPIFRGKVVALLATSTLHFDSPLWSIIDLAMPKYTISM